MADLTLVEAVNDALHTELGRDPNVMVMGEDVGRAGGVFRATAGLRDRFGADRCVDTPLAEAGILGTAVGLSGDLRTGILVRGRCARRTRGTACCRNGPLSHHARRPDQHHETCRRH